MNDFILMVWVHIAFSTTWLKWENGVKEMPICPMFQIRNVIFPFCCTLGPSSRQIIPRANVFETTALQNDNSNFKKSKKNKIIKNFFVWFVEY